MYTAARPAIDWMWNNLTRDLQSSHSKSSWRTKTSVEQRNIPQTSSIFSWNQKWIHSRRSRSYDAKRRKWNFKNTEAIFLPSLWQKLHQITQPQETHSNSSPRAEAILLPSLWQKLHPIKQPQDSHSNISPRAEIFLPSLWQKFHPIKRPQDSHSKSSWRTKTSSIFSRNQKWIYSRRSRSYDAKRRKWNFKKTEAIFLPSLWQKTNTPRRDIGRPELRIWVINKNHARNLEWMHTKTPSN